MIGYSHWSRWFMYHLRQSPCQPFHYKTTCPDHVSSSHYNRSFLSPSAPNSGRPPPPRRRAPPPLPPPLIHQIEMGSSAYYYTGCEYENYQPHFLDSCFLCSRPLNHNSDIFMYRGNTPFCSQECREEQIEMDESMEKRLKLSSSKRSSNTGRQNSESINESDTKKAVRNGTVAVA